MLSVQACKPHCVEASIREALPWGRVKEFVHQTVDAAFDTLADLSAAKVLSQGQQAAGHAATRLRRATATAVELVPRFFGTART